MIAPFLDLDFASPITSWEQDGFCLDLFYAPDDPDHYRLTLAYQFYDHGDLMFEGADYMPSPIHDPDSLGSIMGLLAFLSVQPGDTDEEYFAAYTPRQLAWSQSDRAEELSSIVSDYESPEEA